MLAGRAVEKVTVWKGEELGESEVNAKMSG